MKHRQAIFDNWPLLILCCALAAVPLGGCGGQAATAAPPTALAKVTPAATIPILLTARMPGNPTCPGDRPRDPLGPRAGGTAPSLPLPLPTGAVPTLPRPPAATASRAVATCTPALTTPAATPAP